MDILEFTGKVGPLLVTHGHFSVKINGQDYTLSRGDVMIITPVLIYEDFAESDDLQIQPLKVDIHTFLEQMKQHFQIALYSYFLKHPINHLTDDELRYFKQQIADVKKFEKIANDATVPEPVRKLYRNCYTLSSQSLMLSLVSGILLKSGEAIFTQHGSQKAATPFGDMIVPQFILNLNKHFREERTVAFYAHLASLSVGHFSAIIRKKTGKSPMHWIIIITINNAKVLLKHKNMSIKEIARSLGFPEQFTFRKYFKQHTGLSPSEFRES